MSNRGIGGAVVRVGCAAVTAWVVGDAVGRTPPGGGLPPPPADPAIAFVGNSGSLAGTLCVMNADGTNARSIYTPSGSIPLASNLSWSPDGSSIVFNEVWNLCRIDVVVVNGVPQGANHSVLLLDRPAPKPTGRPPGRRWVLRSRSRK